MHAPAPAEQSFLATRRGKLVLVLVCLAGFLDFVDTTIVNVALPSIGGYLHFSAQSLQWAVSGYLLTYGGFLLLGGRAADLAGRRLLIAGMSVFGLSCWPAAWPPAPACSPAPGWCRAWAWR